MFIICSDSYSNIILPSVVLSKIEPSEENSEKCENEYEVDEEGWQEDIDE